MILFTKGTELTFFGQLKILMMFSININLKTFRLLFGRIPNIWLATKNGLFFTSDVYNNHNLWSCQKVCDALVYLLDNIVIRFGTKLYRQTIGIPMGTNCAPLVADLFLFCYERDFSHVKIRLTLLRLLIQLEDTLMIY